MSVEYKNNEGVRNAKFTRDVAQRIHEARLLSRSECSVSRNDIDYSVAKEVMAMLTEEKGFRCKIEHGFLEISWSPSLADLFQHAFEQESKGKTGGTFEYRCADEHEEVYTCRYAAELECRVTGRAETWSFYGKSIKLTIEWGTPPAPVQAPPAPAGAKAQVKPPAAKRKATKKKTLKSSTKRVKREPA